MKWQNTQRQHRRSTRQKTAAKESGKQNKKKKKTDCILNCCKCFTVFTQPSLSPILLAVISSYRIFTACHLSIFILFSGILYANRVKGLSCWWTIWLLYVLWYLMFYRASVLSSTTYFLSLLLHDSFRVSFQSSWTIRILSLSILYKGCIFEVFTVSNLCTVKRSVDEVLKKNTKWQLLIGFKRRKCNAAYVTVPWGTVD